jgi:hypothetical protein
MSDLVECRSEVTYPERPVAIHWEGQRLEVREVLASWREPGGVRFRVLAGVDQVFEALYDDSNDEWSVIHL